MDKCKMAKVKTLTRPGIKKIMPYWWEYKIPPWKTSLEIAKMLNVYLLYNPAIPLYNLPQGNTNMCTHKDSYMNIDRYLVVIIMATHSSTLAWQIPWMENPGRLQSMGSLGVGHNWATSLSLFHFHALEKEMATHSSVLAWRIPGTEWAAIYGVARSWTWLKRLSSSSYFLSCFLFYLFLIALFTQLSSPEFIIYFLLQYTC